MSCAGSTQGFLSIGVTSACLCAVGNRCETREALTSSVTIGLKTSPTTSDRVHIPFYERSSYRLFVLRIRLIFSVYFVQCSCLPVLSWFLSLLLLLFNVSCLTKVVSVGCRMHVKSYSTVCCVYACNNAFSVLHSHAM